MMCSPPEDLGETITKKQIQPSTTMIYRPSHWEGGRGKGGHGGEIGEDKRGKRGWKMQRPLFEHSLVVVIIHDLLEVAAVAACVVGWGGLGNSGCVILCYRVEMMHWKRLAQYGCRAWSGKLCEKWYLDNLLKVESHGKKQQQKQKIMICRRRSCSPPWHVWGMPWRVCSAVAGLCNNFELPIMDYKQETLIDTNNHGWLPYNNVPI